MVVGFLVVGCLVSSAAVICGRISSVADQNLAPWPLKYVALAISPTSFRSVQYQVQLYHTLPHHILPLQFSSVVGVDDDDHDANCANIILPIYK